MLGLLVDGVIGFEPMTSGNFCLSGIYSDKTSQRSKLSYTPKELYKKSNARFWRLATLPICNDEYHRR